jgi:hypothetical protein
VYSQSLVKGGDSGDSLWPDPKVARSGWVFLALLKRCFCAHPPGVLIRRAAFERVGYFDEQLQSNEDYDMWLRVAQQFPFQFVPGAVAVHHQSSEGVHYSSMSHGAGADDARIVVSKAHRALPRGRRYDAIRRETWMGMELEIALQGHSYSNPEARWRAVLATLVRYPDLLGYRWARGVVGMAGFDLIASSEAPLERGRALCRQLCTPADGSGGRRWWARRLTMSTLWAEAAMAMGSRNGQARGAAGAAALAIACNPAKVRMVGLLQLILRGFLARRAS